MAPIVSALLTAGPSIIRMIGELSGGDKQTTADKVARVIEAAAPLGKTIAGAQVEKELAAMTPEQLTHLNEITVRLAEIERDREASRLNADSAQLESEEVTHRVEAQSESQFVKETRPRIARWSAIAAFVYIFLVLLINAIANKNLATLDPYLILTIYSPALGYMGMRTIGTVAEAIKAMALMRASIR